MPEDGKNNFQEYLESVDAKPDRIDLRDRFYRPPLESLPDQVPNIARQHVVRLYVEAGMILDQKVDGPCTGFGMAAVINFLSWLKELRRFEGEVGVLDPSMTLDEHGILLQEMKERIPSVSARMLYHVARFYDEWPGEENKGSSLRGVMKAWYRHGACSESYWPSGERFQPPLEGWAEDAASRPLGVYYRIERSSVVDMQAAIYDVGAILVSARVHSGWDLKTGEQSGADVLKDYAQDTLPVIPWVKESRFGMHAFAIVGYNRHGFVVQNSWGRRWGAGGFAVLTYQDWLANGIDARVAVLGAPIEQKTPPRVFMESSRARASPPSDGSDGSRIDPNFWKRGVKITTTSDKADTPAGRNSSLRSWTIEDCYNHAVIIGSNGRAINRLVEQQNASAAIHKIACELPGKQFAEWHGSRKETRAKVVIYALSGLLSDHEEIKRIRSLAPYYEANRVYPVFIGWQSGFSDPFFELAGSRIMSLLPRDSNLMEFLLGSQDERTTDSWNRTLEAMFQTDGAKPMWTQLLHDALLAAQPTPMIQQAGPGQHASQVKEQSALHLLATELGRLKREWPNLEIHLVGHSAGAVALCHLLPAISRAMGKPKKGEPPPITSCSLYAPACSVWLANWRFGYYLKNNLLAGERIFRWVLSDDLEQRDSFGPYRKSFLYLVSRALEDWPRTPILGMENSDIGAYWHEATWGLVNDWSKVESEFGLPRATIVKDLHFKLAPGTEIEASHKTFPDDISIAGQSLLQITGKKSLAVPVTNLDWRAL